MDLVKKTLQPNIYEAIDRAGISTTKILTLSMWDLKKLTGLQTKDIELLKKTVAKHYFYTTITCNNLLNYKYDKIKSNCASIDNLLNGGFRRRVLIEIYGESGSGKTQLAAQLAANNASEGSVYICTEDLFPIKRYNQIHNNIMQCNGQIGNNMFIEHIYEAPDLLSCIRVRLTKLLEQHKVSLVIIDSIAAPFRSETSNYIQRAEELREIAIMLTRIAKENNLAVICMNQVSSSFDDSSSKLLPSLGLAWSNMISYRLWLKKSNNSVIASDANKCDFTTMRKLKLMFAPDLPNASCHFTITAKGITDV